MLVRLGRLIAFLLAALGLASGALAQNQCRIPPEIASARAIFPPPGESVSAPRTGHILAMTWSPQFCKENGDDSEHEWQCRQQRFGFVLHGLWADGAGRNNPVWCKKVAAVPPAVVRQSFCATPSADLIQHEWAKHGSCIAPDPATYFRNGGALFAALKFPDMDVLSRRPLTVREFFDALIAVNPGMKMNQFRLTLTPLGWLEDLKLCLDASFHATACPGDIGGAGLKSKMKIWRSG